jgi:tetratricopeptide (TPR) repeat protein
MAFTPEETESILRKAEAMGLISAAPHGEDPVGRLRRLIERGELSSATLQAVADEALGPVGHTNRSGEQLTPPPSTDRYEVREMIGAGGSGEVWKAWDRELGRFVALKLLNSGGGLRREAQLQARVDHPNVCKVHEVGQTGDRPFIAMQYIDGGPLTAVAAAMNRDEKVATAIAVCDALEAAHAVGLIHRDLKPSNILVERLEHGWHPYVCDFGIATEIGAAGSTGHLLGTPEYMAPEQVGGGRTIDERADVYGLGATLYALLTGGPPFPGTTGEVLRRLASEPAPPLRACDPALARDLEAIVARCLEKEPAQRYPSARALAEDLRRFLAGAPVTAHPLSVGYRARSWIGHNRARVATAAGLALVLVGLSVAGLSRREAAARRPSLAVLPFAESGAADRPRIAPLVATLMGRELAADDRFRAVGGEAVARFAADVDAASLGPAVLAAARERLGVDYLVTGAILAHDDGRLHLDAAIKETASGAELHLAGVEGDDEHVADLVARAAALLRRKLEQTEQPPAKGSVPADPDAARSFERALDELRRHEAQSAIADLRLSAAAEPGFIATHLALADAYWYLGRDNEARIEAQFAVSLAAGRPASERLRAQARLYETAGDAERAAELYERLWHDHPDDLKYGLHLGDVYWRSGNAAGQRRVLRELMRIPTAVGDPRIDELQLHVVFEDGDRLLAWSLAERLRAGGVAQALQGLKVEVSILWAWGLYDEAVARAHAAIELARQLGDRVGWEWTMWLVGNVELDRGRLDAAAAALSGIDARSRATRSVVVERLEILGAVALARGDVFGARRLYDEAVAASASAVQRRSVQAVLARRQGAAALAEGDLEGARTLIEASIRVARTDDWRGDIAYSDSLLAEIDLEQGDLAGARAKLDEALAIWRERDAPVEELRVRLALGRLALRAGQPLVAETAARSLFVGFAAYGLSDDRALAACLLADALRAEGRSDEAASISLPVATERPAVRLSLAAVHARALGDRAALEAVVGAADALGLHFLARRERAEGSP